MSTTLPTGWTNFAGGGTLDQCGEVPQDDDDTNNVIPEITIETRNGAGQAIPAELFCEPRQYKVAYRVIYLKALGGVPPFSWITGEGIAEATGPRTAKVSIMAGIEYFKPFWFGYYEVKTDPLIQYCYPENLGDTTHRVYAEASGQIFLIGYDCSGEPIGPISTLAGSPGVPPDFLFPTRNYFKPNVQTLRENLPSGGTFVDVIGNTTDRIATTSFGGDCISVTDTGLDNLLSLDNSGCCADGDGFNPLALLAECKTANKACYNAGIVDVSAPNFSDIFNIPINSQNSPGSAPEEVIYGTPDNRIYVQTPAMMPGHEILITATDYRGRTSLITVTT